MGRRSEGKRQRREDAQGASVRNRVVKAKERARRNTRMMETIRKDDPPYSPTVMSWLSRSLNKKASKITADDVKTLISQP